MTTRHHTIPPVSSDKLRAAGLMLGASALIATSTSFAKALGTSTDPLHPLQVTAGRYVFALLALSLFCLWQKPELTRPNLPLHATRIVVGFCGVAMMFAAVALIPLADATALSFLNPVFGMIFATILLREIVGPWRWAAAAISLIGAAILLRPGMASFQPAALLALAAAICFGAEVTAMKVLTRSEGTQQILLINNFGGVVLAGLAACLVWQAPTPAQWIQMAGVGLAMVAAQTLYITSVRKTDLSFVVPFSYATLIFAAGIDFAIFMVRLDTFSVLGAIVILTGAALLTWREALRSQPS